MLIDADGALHIAEHSYNKWHTQTTLQLVVELITVNSFSIKYNNNKNGEKINTI